MSMDTWVVVATGLISIIVQLLSSAKTRGEFRSVMRNFPPHRHQNGTIAYSAEYPPAEVERPRG